MAKTIAKYADQAAYVADAANRSGLTSVVSMIGGSIRFDKKNVITDFVHPELGDSAYYDNVAGKVVLIKAGTLDISKLDVTRYINLNNTCIGKIYGKYVFVDDRQLPSEKYATPDEWKISGFDLSQDGSAEIKFKYYSGSGTYDKNLTISWTAGATMASIRSQITAAAGIRDYCVPFAISDTEIGVEVNGYNSAIGLEVISGDLTVERTYQGYQTRYYPDLPYSTEVMQHCGTVTYYGWMQFEKMYDYFSVSGSQSKAALGGDPLRLSAFTEAANPALYNAYNGDYMAYMQAEYNYGKVQYPVAKFSMADLSFGDNKNNNAILANVSHVRSDGQTVYDFPNAHSAHLLGTAIQDATTGFEPGTGHLGGNAEAYLLYTQTAKAQNDLINLAIAAKNGTKVAYNTTTRLAFQSGSHIAWLFHGTYGYLYFGNARYCAYPARVFRAFSPK